MVTIEEIESKIKEIDKDRRILQLELENLKLKDWIDKNLIETTSKTSTSRTFIWSDTTPRAWDP